MSLVNEVAADGLGFGGSGSLRLAQLDREPDFLALFRQAPGVGKAKQDKTA